MRCRALAVVLSTVTALSGLAPVAAQKAATTAPVAASEVATLTAAGRELRASRAELLLRIATLTDGADGARARLVGSEQRVAWAEAVAADAGRTLVEHAVQAFVHNGALPAAARSRSGIFAEVVVGVDRAVLHDVDHAAASAAAARTASEAALRDAQRLQAELVAAREALEATIAAHDVRAAAVIAEAERNALARRVAEDERARAEAAEEEVRRAGEALVRDSAAGPPTGGTPAGGGASTPPGGSIGATALGAGPPAAGEAGPTPLGADRPRSLDRVGRATTAQAALMAAHPFGPIGGLPPGATPTGEVVEGMASWYGPGFDGRPTATGALYDQQGWTVASRELPLGTVLVVTRGARSVLVLVNDRGPYVSGRVLDLSRAVADELGTVGPGVANVRAVVVLL